MKIEQLSPNSYRVRKVYKGNRYTVYFDHKPSQAEIISAMDSQLKKAASSSGSFKQCAEEYIRIKTNVLSPASIYKYNSLLKALSDNFLKTPICEVNTKVVQEEINNYAKDHSPKSVRNLHGFISSVIGLNCPEIKLGTTLPQKASQEKYLPTEKDIQVILLASHGTEDHVAFQLGVLSLRRAEICALDMSDLNGNELRIHKSYVYNKKWIIKENAKTDAGNRTIILPDSLVEEIKKQGYFFKYSPNKLAEHLHKYQDTFEIPRFPFHQLRHYFASYTHSLGIPEADAMAMGGWKSDYVFKQVYRESMEKSLKESSALIASKIIIGQ